MEDYDFLKASDGTGEAALAHVTANRAVAATTLQVDTVDNWPAGGFIATSGTLLASGFIDPDTATVFYGHISGGNIEIDGFAAGYSDIGNEEDQVVVIKQTTKWADDMVTAALNEQERARSGWFEAEEEWSYASATTITVPSDATTKYIAGMAIKVTQSTGGTKYGVISVVASTLLTIVWLNSATLVNEAISDPHYSVAASPLGIGKIGPERRTGGFKVGTFTITASGSKAITGVGFTPKAIHAMYISGSSATVSNHGVGWTDGSSQFANTVRGTEGGDISGWGVTDAFVVLTGANAATHTKASITSMDSDGFTINVATYSGNATFGYVAYG